MRALIVLTAFLVGGCSAISNFDFTFTDEDAGPRTDAGDGDVDAGPRMDAGDMDVDAGPDTDAGPGVDGGPPPPRCPAPCLGDALNDFAPMMQGNGALDWRYHHDGRAAPGLAYPELTWGTHDGLDGFGGPGGSPIIAACDDNAAEPRCNGLGEHFVVLSDPPGAGRDAVFSFEASSRASIRVQGSLRLPDGVSSAETHRVFISRNARHDIAAVTTFVPTATPTDLDQVIDVLAGDRVIVTFQQLGGGAPVPLGVQLWVTRMGAPVDDNCQIGLTFNGGDPLLDVCGNFTVENLVDSSGMPPGPSTVGAGPSAWLGDARAITDEGQYLRIARSPANYSGDFTIQLWANVSSAARFDHSLYADSTSDAPPGGVSISMNGGRGNVRTFYSRMGPACSEPRPGVCVVSSTLGTITNDEWHFYRASRNTVTNEILVCVDGLQLARLAVQGSLDLTGPYRPHLGRNVSFNPAYYQGSIDDVRVYDVALPCEL